jgi:hypothetical protein
LIDQTNVSFKAASGAAMDPKNAKITAENNTVQEFSTFYASFSFPVPIQSGCRLLLRLPDDFTLKSGDISIVQGWGIFGGKRKLTADVDNLARTIKIVN